MASRWDRYWFGEASLVRLGAFRIVIMSAAFYGVYHFGVAVFQHADGASESFLSRSWNPIYAFEALGVQPPGSTTVRVIYTALLGSLLFGILGLFTRVACAVAALLTFYWIGVHYSFGKPHHDCIQLMFGLIALPFAPVGARLSLDSLWRRLRVARAGTEGALTPAIDGAYAALPLRLTQISVAIGYCFAGSTKLMVSGPGWADGYTLQGIMLEYRSAWSGPLADQVWLCAFMSTGLLFVQVSFPLVFLSPLLRWFYVPMGLIFHLIAMQTMATGPFLTLWFTLVCFVPMERAPAFLGATVARGPWWRRLLVASPLVALAWITLALYFTHIPMWLALTLIPLAATLVLGLWPSLRAEVCYDGKSPAARRAVAWLDACDWSGRLRFTETASVSGGLSLAGTSGDSANGVSAWRGAAMRTPLFPLLVLLPYQAT